MTDVWCGIIAANAFIFRRLVVVGLQKKKKRKNSRELIVDEVTGDKWWMVVPYAMCMLSVWFTVTAREEDREMAVWERVENFGRKNEKAQGRTHAETQIG